ncbi:MAG: hypothetical protein H0V24_07200 [Chloroflexia bacterium]|nr:hypothetical protein [Chloroflexia bacterium]
MATTFLTDRPDLMPDPANVPVPAVTQESLTEPVVAEVNGRRFVVRVPVELAKFGPGGANRTRLMRPDSPLQAGGTTGAPAGEGDDLTSPIQGTVLRVLVAAGATVRRGDVICVVEAMKMENELVAHRDGTIHELRVSPGTKVRIQDVVATIQ